MTVCYTRSLLLFLPAIPRRNEISVSSPPPISNYGTTCPATKTRNNRSKSSNSFLPTYPGSSNILTSNEKNNFPKHSDFCHITAPFSSHPQEKKKSIFFPSPMSFPFYFPQDTEEDLKISPTRTMILPSKTQKELKWSWLTHPCCFKSQNSYFQAVSQQELQHILIIRLHLYLPKLKQLPSK